MSGNSSLEKYTSHFIAWVVCERWVGDWTKTATYRPLSSPGYIKCVFLVLLGCSTGGLWTHLSAESWFSRLELEQLFKLWTPTDSNFLCTELYNCFTSTQFKPSTVKVIPGHPRPDAPVIYTGAFLILTAWPARRSTCNRERERERERKRERGM